MTEEEIAEKYSNIDDKIPIIWTTLSDVSNELAKDIAFLWDIKDYSLIRLISKMSVAPECKNNLSKHIDSMFAYAGLYPHTMKTYNIDDIGISENESNRLKELILYRALLKEGYFNIKRYDDIGVCAILKFAFTTGLVVGIDEIGYSGLYCYEHNFDAVKAINRWDGKNDPPGNWIKYKGELGEKRNPNYKKHD